MACCAGPSLLCLLVISSSVCLAARGRYAQQLFRDLFVNYTSALRPVENTDNAINVTLQVTLSQIIDMDEKNQILTLYLWVRQVWMDSFLTWSKDDYDGLDSIQIPSRYVWKPDIVLYNSADDEFSSSMETNVALRSDGQVTWDQPSITKSSCSVDVAFFPFDLQECILTFGSWTHNGNQMDLNIQLDTADLADLVPNVEWQVLGMPAKKNVILYGCCSDPYPDITFTLQLKRRASFYIFNLLLPCMMISFLAPLGFYLPAESGEKVSLGVTVLLALTVFQLLVAESMPPSESVPLIGKYYIATMTMVTASTALTIFIMNLHHCGPEARPVPDWVRVLVLKYLNQVCLVYELGETCTREESQAAGGAHNWEDNGAAGFTSMGDELSVTIESLETSKRISARTKDAVSKPRNLQELMDETICDRENVQRQNGGPQVCQEENEPKPSGFKDQSERADQEKDERKEKKQNGGRAGEKVKMAATKMERKREDVCQGEEQVKDEQTVLRYRELKEGEKVKVERGHREKFVKADDTGVCCHCCCRHLGLRGDAPWARLSGDVTSIATSFQEEKVAQALSGDWRKVAKVLDRALMWIFFIMVFVMSVLILGKSI